MIESGLEPGRSPEIGDLGVQSVISDVEATVTLDYVKRCLDRGERMTMRHAVWLVSIPACSAMQPD